jgi:hypothetical protein
MEPGLVLGCVIDSKQKNLWRSPTLSGTIVELQQAKRSIYDITG